MLGENMADFQLTMFWHLFDMSCARGSMDMNSSRGGSLS